MGRKRETEEKQGRRGDLRRRGGSDVAQCSVTEAVMSSMQHTAKVIPH